jgi:hypothetical protein
MPKAILLSCEGTITNEARIPVRPRRKDGSPRGKPVSCCDGYLLVIGMEAKEASTPVRMIRASFASRASSTSTVAVKA